MTAFGGFLLGVVCAVVVTGIIAYLRSRSGNNLSAELRRFFGIEPKQLAIVSRTLPTFELTRRLFGFARSGFDD